MCNYFNGNADPAKVLFLASVSARECIAVVEPRKVGRFAQYEQITLISTVLRMHCGKQSVR